tara:strand:+ start:10661 stop:11299 length:639 start_codon:yes stop_codon:yes gene_type:complete
MNIIERYLDLKKNTLSSTEAHFTHNHLLQRICELNKSGISNKAKRIFLSIIMLACILIFLLAFIFVSNGSLHTIAKAYLYGLFAVCLLGQLYLSYENKIIMAKMKTEISGYNKAKGRTIKTLPELISDLNEDVKVLRSRKRSYEREYDKLKREIKPEDLKRFMSSKPKINAEKHEYLSNLADYLLNEKKKARDFNKKINEIEDSNSENVGVA